MIRRQSRVIIKPSHAPSARGHEHLVMKAFILALKVNRRAANTSLATKQKPQQPNITATPLNTTTCYIFHCLYYQDDLSCLLQNAKQIWEIMKLRFAGDSELFVHCSSTIHSKYIYCTSLL